jgi:hypothetical protein
MELQCSPDSAQQLYNGRGYGDEKGGEIVPVVEGALCEKHWTGLGVGAATLAAQSRAEQCRADEQSKDEMR